MRTTWKRPLIPVLASLFWPVNQFLVLLILGTCTVCKRAQNSKKKMNGIYRNRWVDEGDGGDRAKSGMKNKKIVSQMPRATQLDRKKM